MGRKVEEARKKNRKYTNLKIENLGLKNENLHFRDKNKTSLGFNIDISKSVYEYLSRLFDVSNPKRFESKLREVISGDGQEINKINALASSSLCALLCFYNVSKERKLKYEGYTYDDVYFEVRNKVVSKPSNMDVVLIGKNEKEESSILFVECKYSEFLGTGKYALGKTYSEGKYASLFREAEYDEATVFQYGIKQLITHYLGIRNFIDAKNKEKYKEEMKKHYPDGEENRIKLYRAFDHVGFLEVIFEFAEEKDYETYKKETEIVFNALRDKEKGENKKIDLYGTITYQKLFSDENRNVLDEMVKKFYTKL